MEFMTSYSIVNAPPDVQAGAYREQEQAYLREQQKKPIELEDDQILYSTDLLMKTICSGVVKDTEEYKGHVSTASDREKRKGIEVGLDFLIYFYDKDTNVRLSRSIDGYDKQLLYAFISLYVQGIRETSAYALWRKMGFRGSFSGADKEKIISRLIKLMQTIITVSNRSEQQSRKNAPVINIKGAPLLYFEFEVAESKYNNRIIEDSISIKIKPAVLRFIETYGQFSTIEDKVFMIPDRWTRKTDIRTNLQTELIDLILFTKHNPKEAPKNGYSIINLAHKLGVYHRMQIQRLKEDLQTLLQYYADIKFIEGFSIDAKNFKIFPQKSPTKTSSR